MAQTEIMSTMAADPVERSRVYRLLSRGFRYPDAGTFKAFRTGEFLDELLAALSGLSHLDGISANKEEVLMKFQGALEGVSEKDLEVKFVRTFDVGDLEPPAPLYEGLYREKEDRSNIMLEVSEFYKQFGLKMNPSEGKREVPDHLCAELEFLHFLTFKEAQAREEGNQELLKGYILAQKDFLERHLVKWIPAFSEKLQQQADVPFYHELAALTSQFVNAELELVRSLLMDLGAGQA